MKILYNFASRSRPYKLLKCLEEIESLSVNKKYEVLVKIDDDDNTCHIIATALFVHSNVMIVKSLSRNKIDAINRDVYKVADWNILINMSDDMSFFKPGFDNIIRRDMQEHFPDLDGVLHYNDGVMKSNVMTMSIMGRKYYEKFGYIYHPDYTSVRCDYEATEVAYMLGKYKYMGNSKMLFKHLHPNWGLADWDEQYKKTEDPSVYGADNMVIARRKSTNYGLKKEEIVKPYKYAMLP